MCIGGKHLFWAKHLSPIFSDRHASRIPGRKKDRAVLPTGLSEKTCHTCYDRQSRHIPPQVPVKAQYPTD